MEKEQAGRHDPFEIYFHLGYTKVASTWFQRVVFPSLEGIRFYKKHDFKKYRQFAGGAVAGTMVRGEGSFEKRAGEEPGVSLSGKHLFSTEKDRRIIQAVEELGALFPEAGFIVFLRRQDDWLLSRYKYRIRKHGRESFTEFFDLSHNNGVWKKETLYYRKVIEAMERNSSRRPLVLLYDQLREDPAEFIRRITAYTGTRIGQGATQHPARNIAFSEKQLLILRNWNRRFPYRHKVSRVSLINTLHSKWRDLLLHSVAFFAELAPDRWVAGQAVLTDAEKESLEQIRKHYSEDWAFCMEYAKPEV